MTQSGTSPYLAVFLLMALAFIRIPAVGPAYGAGRVVASEQDWQSLGALVAGLAVAAGCAVLAARY